MPPGGPKPEEFLGRTCRGGMGFPLGMGMGMPFIPGRWPFCEGKRGGCPTVGELGGIMVGTSFVLGLLRLTMLRL